MLLIGLLATEGHAGQVRGIRSLTTDPITPRGGVLMLPLGAKRAGDGWPDRLHLTLDDGSVLVGTVAWFHRIPDDDRRPRGWTDEASSLVVRAIRESDDTSVRGTGLPYLLVRVPWNADGRIRLARQMGGQTLNPQWKDPSRPYAGIALPGADTPPLPFDAGPHRPDAQSPFAYWRWVLLADSLDLRPPGLDRYGPVGALVAEHYADLWRIALHRLGSSSPGIAETVRDHLTRICLDGRRPFAAWTTDQAELSALLSMLLDFRRRDELVQRDALAWLDSRLPLLAWPEAEQGSSVTVAVVNRGFRSVIARMRWHDSTEVPTAQELPPGVLTRLRIERPPLPEPDPALGPMSPAEPERQTLEIQADLQTLRLAFGRRVSRVGPPGAVFPTFRPALRLAEVQSLRQRTVAEDRLTSMHVRKRAGRWEVFIECRRPATGADRLAGSLTRFRRPEEIRGVEAVILQIGPPGEPTLSVAIPEVGPPHFYGSEPNGLEAYRSSFADRWLCRVVLPSSVLVGTGAIEVTTVGPSGELAFRPAVAVPLRLGARRAHGDGDAVETTPSTSAPWCQNPGHGTLDLSAWPK